MNAKLDRDKFLVNQKHRAWMKSKYYVFDDAGTPLFYVERPSGRVFRRSNITIFDDDTRATEVLVMEQIHLPEWRRREYHLVDAATGERIAMLSRDNLASLFRRAWVVSDPQGVIIARAREDSAGMALVRRVIDFIPYVSLLGGVFKTDFHLFTVDTAGAETKAGSFDRKISLSDKYVLNLADDPQRLLDRRIALGLGILLDTAEAR